MDPNEAGAAPAIVGQILLVIGIAVPLAYFVSRILLAIYMRAVTRSMLHRASEVPAGQEPIVQAAATAAPPSTSLEIATLSEDRPRLKGVTSKPWINAAIYAAAGLGFAAVLAAAHLRSSGLELLPARFALVGLTYAWPAVLTAGLVAATSRRGWIVVIGAYLFLFAAASGVVVLRSETFTWAQAVLGWLIVNLVPTLLVLAFLARRIRAVGPLVLVFMIALVGGAVAATTVESLGFRYMIDISQALGVDAVVILNAFRIVGAAIVGLLIGWPLLHWLGRLYTAGRITDQSIEIDALWMVFAILGSALLAAANGPRWLLAGPAAFLAYKAVALAGFALRRRLSTGWSRPAPSLLLLRVFSLGPRSADLFDAFGKTWRHTGSIRLIAGPDLASTTVEPHEFLDFLGGRLARRFIADRETLDRRLAETAPRRDFDGRLRVGDFFCHDDTWKMVLARLARESDAVLMDLRGFSSANSGCVFELNELLDVVALDRVVLVVDATTSDAFLRQTLADGWARVAAGSPNRATPAPRVRLFPWTGMGEGNVSALVRSVAAAAFQVRS